MLLKCYIILTWSLLLSYLRRYSNGEEGGGEITECITSMSRLVIYMMNDTH